MNQKNNCTKDGIYTKKIYKYIPSPDLVKEQNLYDLKVVESSVVVSVPIEVWVRISFVINRSIDDAIDGLNTS